MMVMLQGVSWLAATVLVLLARVCVWVTQCCCALFAACVFVVRAICVCVSVFSLLAMLSPFRSSFVFLAPVLSAPPLFFAAMNCVMYPVCVVVVNSV